MTNGNVPVLQKQQSKETNKDNTNVLHLAQIQQTRCGTLPGLHACAAAVRHGFPMLMVNRNVRALAEIVRYITLAGLNVSALKELADWS